MDETETVSIDKKEKIKYVMQKESDACKSFIKQYFFKEMPVARIALEICNKTQTPEKVHKKERTAHLICIGKSERTTRLHPPEISSNPYKKGGKGKRFSAKCVTRSISHTTRKNKMNPHTTKAERTFFSTTATNVWAGKTVREAGEV